MTRDQFRTYVTRLVDSLVSLPDDIWDNTCPGAAIVLRDEGVRKRIAVEVVDLDDLDDDDEDGDDC